MIAASGRRSVLDGAIVAATALVIAACWSGTTGANPLPTATPSAEVTAASGAPPTSTSISRGGAPTGTVVQVGKGEFVLEVSGRHVTVDTVAGSTYQLTATSKVTHVRSGEYVAGLGTVSGGELMATHLAIVPDPPSFVASWDITSTPQGAIYFGRVTAVDKGAITITTGDGPRTISTAAETAVTSTKATTFKAIKVGETVEVNGPERSSTVYTGHQINIGKTPAVVGQFD